MQNELMEIIKKYDEGAFLIDVRPENNPDLFKSIETLVSILDDVSEVVPFTGETYSRYILKQEFYEWDFLTSHGVSSKATLSRVPPKGQEVMTVDDIVIIASGLPQTAENFDSLFD